jgi:hypothetical protein
MTHELGLGDSPQFFLHFIFQPSEAPPPPPNPFPWLTPRASASDNLTGTPPQPPPHYGNTVDAVQLLSVLASQSPAAAAAQGGTNTTHAWGASSNENVPGTTPSLTAGLGNTGTTNYPAAASTAGQSWAPSPQRRKSATNVFLVARGLKLSGHVNCKYLSSSCRRP